MFPSTDRVYDVAVVGGGILGVSVARDCAMRRLSVVLIEKDDFGAGTTGAGSGILSGEPHWLATDPQVTRIACEEINVFQRIAPNLLTRIPILYPTLASESPTDLDRMQALADLYDRYAQAKGGRAHVRLEGKDIAAIDPGFSSDVRGAVSMDEWTTDPTRITIAIARSATSAGATLCKGIQAEKIATQKGKAIGIHVRTSGAHSSLIRARTIVNATGPGVSGLMPKRSVELRYFKRSYLIFERRITEVAIGCSLPRRSDPVYFFPRESVSWLGATENAFDRPPSDTSVSPEEVDQVFQTVGKFFPRIHEHRLLGTVSGIHCRVEDLSHPEGRPQAVFDHGTDGIEGFYSLFGGGLTRARRLAEQVTDLICQYLRQRERCRTHLESLPGCTSEIPWLEEARRTQRDPLLVARLIRRYGHKAQGILDAAARNPELGQTLCECEQILAAEVEYTVRKEWVSSLSDLQRRTGLGAGNCRGCRCSLRAACFLGSLLHWNNDEVLAQAEAAEGQFDPAVTWGEQAKQKEYASLLKGFSGRDHG